MNNDHSLRQVREDLREVSKRVFSKTYRLEIVAVVAAQEPPIWARRVAQILQIPENIVSGELSAYAEMGALQHFPLEHDRRKVYQLSPHPIWQFGRDLVERAIYERASESAEELFLAFWSSLLDSSEPRPIPK
jgi:hypothetical protein